MQMKSNTKYPESSRRNSNLRVSATKKPALMSNVQRAEDTTAMMPVYKRKLMLKENGHIMAQI